MPPGPRLPAVVQTARWLGRHIGFMEENRRRFGPVFSLRFFGVPGTLAFVHDPASAKQLLSADREHSLPDGRALLIEPVLGSRSLLLLEGDEHLRRRKLMLPPLHGEHMRAYEQAIITATRESIERWPVGEPFAIRERTQQITFEVIMRAVFGVGGDRRHEELRGLLNGLLEAGRNTRLQMLVFVSDSLGPSSPLGPAARQRAKLERVDELIFELVAERRRDPGLAERADILSLLLAARFEDGSAMEDREVRDQLMTLLVAGHETTATALAWAFDLLLHTPGALAPAVAAADAGDDEYLAAVGWETQRLRPVVTSVGRKLGSDGVYAGFELPAGTSLMVSVYLLQTSAEVYEQPYAFDPARFAGSRPETYSWLPFGGGIRRCIGAAFAELEMRTVLREVLAALELRPAAPGPDRARLAGITLIPDRGVPVIARARGRAAGLQPVSASSRSKTSPALRR